MADPSCSHWNTEYRALHADGTTHWLRVTVSGATVNVTATGDVAIDGATVKLNV